MAYRTTGGVTGALGRDRSAVQVHRAVEVREPAVAGARVEEDRDAVDGLEQGRLDDHLGVDRERGDQADATIQQGGEGG